MGNIQYAIGTPFDNIYPNKLTNGDFDADLGVTSWTLVNCAAVREAGVGKLTDYPDAMQLTVAGSGLASATTTVTTDVTGALGDRYAFSVWVKFSTASGTIDVDIEMLGGAYPTGTGIWQATIASTGAWYHIAGEGTIDYDDRTSITMRVSRAGATAAQVIRVARARLWIFGQNDPNGDFLGPVDVFGYNNDGSTPLVAGYPAANANNSILGCSVRFDTSPGGTSGTVWFDFGYPVRPDAVFVEGLNTTATQIVAMEDNYGTSIYEGTASTVSANPFTKRYSRLLENDVYISPTNTARFWGIRFQTATAVTPKVRSSDTYFEVARICWIAEDGLRTIAQNWGTPYRTQTNQPSTSGRYAGGLTFDRNVCPLYMSFSMQQDFDLSKGDTIEADVGRLLSMERTERILHFENKGASFDANNARAYICRQAGSVGADYGSWPVLIVSMGLEELS